MPGTPDFQEITSWQGDPIIELPAGTALPNVLTSLGVFNCFEWDGLAISFTPLTVDGEIRFFWRANPASSVFLGTRAYNVRRDNVLQMVTPNFGGTVEVMWSGSAAGSTASLTVAPINGVDKPYSVVPYRWALSRDNVAVGALSTDNVFLTPCFGRAYFWLQVLTNGWTVKGESFALGSVVRRVKWYDRTLAAGTVDALEIILSNDIHRLQLVNNGAGPANYNAYITLET